MTQTTITTEMHRVFLDEIRLEKAGLQAQIDRLAAVESYHEDAINKAPTNGKVITGTSPAPIATASPDAALFSATRHDACAVALKSLGVKATTSTITEWLLKKGYGQDVGERALQSACFVAMARKKDMFRKVGKGTWELK